MGRIKRTCDTSTYTACISSRAWTKAQTQPSGDSLPIYLVYDSFTFNLFHPLLRKVQLNWLL